MEIWFSDIKHEKKQNSNDKKIFTYHRPLDPSIFWSINLWLSLMIDNFSLGKLDRLENKKDSMIQISLSSPLSIDPQFSCWLVWLTKFKFLYVFFFGWCFRIIIFTNENDSRTKTSDDRNRWHKIPGKISVRVRF